MCWFSKAFFHCVSVQVSALQRNGKQTAVLFHNFIMILNQNPQNKNTYINCKGQGTKVAHFGQTLGETWRIHLVRHYMLTSHFDGTSSLCQDPHLNRFFQQCQKRELDLSLPPTSNFLNCLKVRESPSSISCDRDRNQLLPSARQSHACQTTFDPLPSV